MKLFLHKHQKNLPSLGKAFKIQIDSLCLTLYVERKLFGVNLSFMINILLNIFFTITDSIPNCPSHIKNELFVKSS